MIPKVDPGWLKIFEQKGWIYLSLSLFCVALRYLLKNRLLPSLTTYEWLADASLLGATMFGLLTIGSVGHWVAGWVKRYGRNRKLRKAVLSRLDSLSDIEHRILSYLVQANCQSFNNRIDVGDIQQLVQKRLLNMAGGRQKYIGHSILGPRLCVARA